MQERPPEPCRCRDCAPARVRRPGSTHSHKSLAAGPLAMSWSPGSGKAPKAARADNTPRAETRTTTRSLTADLRRVGRSNAVRAGDRLGARSARRTRSAPRRRRVQPVASPVSCQREPAARIRCQTAARCSAPADCAA
jgi:hypothetical protein